jgi:hypothetical protein
MRADDIPSSTSVRNAMRRARKYGLVAPKVKTERVAKYLHSKKKRDRQ